MKAEVGYAGNSPGFDRSSPAGERSFNPNRLRPKASFQVGNAPDRNADRADTPVRETMIGATIPEVQIRRQAESRMAPPSW